MKIVAFVPIKLNSERLKNKNLLPLGSHSLCWYIFNTLLKVKEIDEIYCYCSDEKICSYIPKEIKFLKRDAVLDGNLIKGFQIYDSFINDVDSDIYMLCHATSPFISSSTIQKGLHAVIFNQYDSAFSVRKIQTFAWYNGNTINYDINNVPRTQDIEPIYFETSAFYMFRKEIFTKHRRRIGFNPFFCEVDDIESIDIDEEKDYRLAINIQKYLEEI